MKKFLRSITTLLVLTMATIWASMAFAADIEPIWGKVGTIEKYGNLDLDIKGTELLAAGYECGDIVTVEMNGKTFHMPIGTDYSDVDQGTMICRAAIDEKKGRDLVILAVNMGDLAKEAEIAAKVKIEEAPGYRWDYGKTVTLPVSVKISMKEKGGYRDGWLIHQLKRTDKREDYESLTDREFANFRPVTTAGMGHRILYRSSSPVNPEIGRNSYADAAMAEAGVKTVMNLADSPEKMQSYEGYGKTYYSAACVLPLNLGVDFEAAEFKAGLKEGLLHLAKNPGPYLIHCTEGKDRAGFVAAVLESLMGASAEEITDDYMASFKNYYGVTAKSDPEKYRAIANSNIRKTLSTAFGVKDMAEKGLDLAKEAMEYLKNDIGLSDKEIGELKDKLGKDGGSSIKSCVKGLEKYGHIDVAICTADFLKHFDYGDMIRATVNGHTFVLPLCTDYTDVKTGEYLIRAAKGKDYIALAINYGQICTEAELGRKEGDKFVFNDGIVQPITVEFDLEEKAGYLEEWQSHHLERTDSRQDYPALTDSEYANFRPVTTTGMGDLVLFRSSSPINPEIGRNACADSAMRSSGIKSAINLADTEEAARGYDGFKDTYYAGQNNIYLGLDVNFKSDAFKAGLKRGLVHMAENQGPYLIHCTEGKDRAGFVAAVLESLMGASSEEIIADYMTSFYNYYGVKPGDRKYDIIARDNIVTNLSIAFGVDDITAPGVDLAKEAEEYVKSLGLSQSDLEALKARLSGDRAMEKAA